MVCKEVLPLIHKYFDGDLSSTESGELKDHLFVCGSCRRYFNQLERAEALIRSMMTVDEVPSQQLTNRILESLPAAKKQSKWYSWMKRHPGLSVAMVFVLLMLGSFSMMWNEDAELTIQGVDLDQIVVQGQTVYIPEGSTIHGDLMVKNGNIQVDGDVKGNITVIDGNVNLASTAQISGHIIPVNEAFSRVKYKITEFFGWFLK